MIRREGFTLVELVTVLVIVTVTAGVFYGLVEKMFESANRIIARKESYQVAREALNQMVNGVLVGEGLRWALRGGDQHNIGQADRYPYVSPDAAWQYCRTFPSTNTRLVYMPNAPDGIPVQGGPEPPADNPNPNTRIRFFWGDNSNLPLPGGWYLRREQDNDDDTATSPQNVRALAAVKNSTQGSLEIRYYDQAGNFIDLGPLGNNVGITGAQAKTVGRIDLILTVNRWGEAVTLTETIYVREKGRLATGAGYL